MIKKLFLFSILTVVLAQCSTENKYDPGAALTAQEKDKVMMTIIRYVAKAPENVSRDEIFTSEHDAYYQERAKQCFLEQFYIAGDDRFFLVSQTAPSLTEKRHATGGRMKLDGDGTLVEYEEIFRTWKMVPDTLRKRSTFLFDKMVKGEPLEPYYTKHTGDQYIEFPDDVTYYDKASRSWKTKY